MENKVCFNGKVYDSIAFNVDGVELRFANGGNYNYKDMKITFSLEELGIRKLKQLDDYISSVELKNNLEKIYSQNRKTINSIKLKGDIKSVKLIAHSKSVDSEADIKIENGVLDIKLNPVEKLKGKLITLKELIKDSNLMSDYWQNNIVSIKKDGEVIFELYRNHGLEIDSLKIINDGEFNENFPNLAVKKIDFDFEENKVNIEVLDPKDL